MKYTIHGFSQLVMESLGMDVVDALLLRYFVDFKDSGRMIKQFIDEDYYYWLKYENVIKEYPTLKFKKDTVYRRYKKMSKKNILKHETIKNQYGTYSYFTLGEEYIDLISSPGDSKGVGLKSEGVGHASVGGTDLNPEHINPSTKHNPLNNKEDFSKVIRFYEENISPSLKGYTIEVLTNLYNDFNENPAPIILAMKIAVKKEARNLKYIEKILMDWLEHGVKTEEEIERYLKDRNNRGGKKTGSNKSNNGEGYTKGPDKETLRLEELAKEKGLIPPGEIQDIECDF
ncbi:hypothetical protein SH2C18_04130 [Clostridium sediminicola]|uniref:DnaD domain-containing protein n=1 Tax=Clostridium sediminicola TaxID=3114879 RepID=UPI0031F1F1FF